jgi:hypothetical protein
MLKKQQIAMNTAAATAAAAAAATTKPDQRRKKIYMTPKRFQLLDEIGFPWDAHEARWLRQYSFLVRYVQNRGNASLPTFGDPMYGKLRKWLRCQNQHYQKYVQGKRTPMTLERKQRLDDVLGSVWRVADTKEQSLPAYLRSDDED